MLYHSGMGNGKSLEARQDHGGTILVEDLNESAFPHLTFKYTSDNQRQTQSKFS